MPVTSYSCLWIAAYEIGHTLPSSSSREVASDWERGGGIGKREITLNSHTRILRHWEEKLWSSIRRRGGLCFGLAEGHRTMTLTLWSVKDERIVFFCYRRMQMKYWTLCKKRYMNKFPLVVSIHNLILFVPTDFMGSSNVFLFFSGLELSYRVKYFWLTVSNLDCSEILWLSSPHTVSVFSEIYLMRWVNRCWAISYCQERCF